MNRIVRVFLIQFVDNNYLELKVHCRYKERKLIMLEVII